MSIERKAAMNQYGTSYKRGTLFFNQETKHDTYILYTFLRVIDNIVDNPATDLQDAARAVNQLRDQFHTLYNHTAPIDNLLLQETVHLAHKYDMPATWFNDFFDAMLADTKQTTYETYEQLQWYMRWSACVVWLMMTKIIWYDTAYEEETFAAATQLGEAMQYTNFLRDIKEDWLEYWRLYIPSDRLAAFSCSQHMIKNFATWTPISTQRRDFMDYQITHLQDQYAQANKGIKQLNPQWRLPVLIASNLYARILKRIKQLWGDVFTRSARTKPYEKILTLIGTIATYKF